VIETSLVRTDLYLADEIFLTGTAAELTPVKEVAGYELGPRGPVTEAVQRTFLAAVRGEESRYHDWLHVVAV
jgi:branched-chain amino acid aminotransferase